MPAHQQFEELCALAVTGQITGDAMATLDRHLKQCDQCRSFLQDVAPLKAHVAPVIAGTRFHDFEPPEGIRERFLRRTAAAGLAIQAGPVLKSITPVEVPELAAKPHVLSRPLDTSGKLRALFTPAGLRYAVAVAACMVCMVAGYFVAQRNLVGRPEVVAVVPPAQAAQQETKARTAQLEFEAASARHQVEALTSDLARVHSDKQHLLEEVSRLAQRAGTAAQFEQQFKAGVLKTQEAEQRVVTLQAQLEEAQKKAADSEAILYAQQHATIEARDKQASLQAQLERDHEFKAEKSDFSHLISARNLHIVDVYDTQSDGKRERPFGRVFYVEGKSLVFYAYDLPADKHREASVVFRVWGETAGIKGTTFKLGILQNDDPKQHRWVLAFDDPRVLARINAVYLTTDHEIGPASEPRGRKLMYAFLGSPNHP